MTFPGLVSVLESSHLSKRMSASSMELPNWWWKDLRRVGIVLIGSVPWVHNTVCHEFGVCLALCGLGHTIIVSAHDHPIRLTLEYQNPRTYGWMWMRTCVERTSDLQEVTSGTKTTRDDD